MTHSTRPGTSRSGALILVPLLVGCAVALALGVYGKAHEPTGDKIFTLGFSGMINMKVWLATIAVGLGLVQLGSALRIYGVFGTGSPARGVTLTHRVSGAAAVVVSAPVAFHCLWSLGFSSFDSRTLWHSLLGCAFYGAFVAKMLTLKMRGLPGWLLPVLGGLTFATLTGVWLTSALWFFRTVGFPEF